MKIFMNLKRNFSISLVILIILSTLFVNIIYNPYEISQDAVPRLRDDPVTSNSLIFPSTYQNLVFWSSDFHISPIEDIKTLLKPYGIRIIDKSLSGHCELMKTCQYDLRIINRENGIDLSSCPNELRKVS